MNVEKCSLEEQLAGPLRRVCVELFPTARRTFHCTSWLRNVWNKCSKIGISFHFVGTFRPTVCLLLFGNKFNAHATREGICYAHCIFTNACFKINNVRGSLRFVHSITSLWLNFSYFLWSRSNVINNNLSSSCANTRRIMFTCCVHEYMACVTEK